LHVWTKNLFFFVLGGMIPLSIVGVLLSFLWVKDIRNDRQHTVVVNAATPVFVGAGHDCNGTPLTRVEKGSKLPVRRIRYPNKGSCATLDVSLPDGRTGYVVLGVGDVSVNPPLPTI
jgi:hypothetical protein